MSVELAFINQLLTKPNSAEKVTLVADGAIAKGAEITINNDGKAESTTYNFTPDNTITSNFMDYPFNDISSTSAFQPYGLPYADWQPLGNGKYIFMSMQIDSNNYRNIYLHTVNFDTGTNVLTPVSNLLVRQGVVAGYNFTDANFQVAPEGDYVMVGLSGRNVLTGSTSYEKEFWRVTLNTSTGALSSPQNVYQTSGSSSVYQYANMHNNTYYAQGTGLNDRYFYYYGYYSTTADSIARVALDGTNSTMSSTSGNPSGWYRVDLSIASVGNWLLYYPNSSTILYHYYPNWNNSSSFGSISLSPTGDDVPPTYNNILYKDEAPDSNGILRMVAWSGGAAVTTYQFSIDGSSATPPSLSGKHTVLLTDARLMTSDTTPIGAALYGNRWASTGDDKYGFLWEHRLISPSNDSTTTNYQAQMIKLEYTSTNGGYYTPTFQGYVDVRAPSISDAACPMAVIDSNGVFALTLSSNWSTTDNASDYKFGSFQVSTTGPSAPAYAYKVKAVALEAASAGNTFQALAYAPVVSDSTLVAGTIYPRHMATSNGLLIEKA